MLQEGAKVIVAGPEEGKTYSGKHGYPCKADLALDSVNPSEYEALIISQQVYLKVSSVLPTTRSSYRLIVDLLIN
jgi:hypothetical protein